MALNKFTLNDDPHIETTDEAAKNPLSEQVDLTKLFTPDDNKKRIKAAKKTLIQVLNYGLALHFNKSYVDYSDVSLMYRPINDMHEYDLSIIISRNDDAGLSNIKGCSNWDTSVISNLKRLVTYLGYSCNNGSGTGLDAFLTKAFLDNKLVVNTSSWNLPKGKVIRNTRLHLDDPRLFNVHNMFGLKFELMFDVIGRKQLIKDYAKEKAQQKKYNAQRKAIGGY